MSDSPKETRYIQFPLCALSLLDESNRFSMLMKYRYYGLTRFALKQDIGNIHSEEVRRKILLHVYYVYQRKTLIGKLPATLSKFLEKMESKGKFELDEGYKGFVGGTDFDPDEDLFEPFKKLFVGYPKMFEQAENAYRLNQAISYFGYQLMNFDKINNKRDSLISEVDPIINLMNGRDAMPSISYELVKSFENNSNPLDWFRYHVSMKSIIGNKSYSNTNRFQLAARMIGAKDNPTLEILRKSNYLNEIYTKYCKPYWFEKIRDQMLIGKLYTGDYAPPRKFYVSCKLNFNELAEAVERDKAARNFNKMRKEAKEKAKLIYSNSGQTTPPT